MPTIKRRQDYFSGQFNAMASPCEILIDATDQDIATEIVTIGANEAARIENKFSRYRDNNIIHQINSGNTVTVDEETARLLDYANQLFELSDGLFDITSGVLRRVWRFDGKTKFPDQGDIDALLPLIGWHKVKWKNPNITLPQGMEIDLGGIGKEYAVDRAAQLAHEYLIRKKYSASVLVNFGGDITVVNSADHKQGRAWHIGVDTCIQGMNDTAGTQVVFEFSQGGIATSGDTRRYLEQNGRRYGHIIDPRTGWPVPGAPSSVTVAAATCTDAGMLSTLALLHGKEAEQFLHAQGVRFWIQW